MYNICLIGFGNIGKRHFEALLKLDLDVKIYIIDIFEAAFNDIGNYDIKSNITVEHSIDYNFLPDEIDLAIIATSSSTRRVCFESLIGRSKVKNIIFEKVLFQTTDDYDKVERSLISNSINAYVNCNRRYMQSYIDFKDKLSSENIKKITISGGNWGLGCNGIHMIDLISYLLNDKELYIYQCNLEKMVDSKRKGFKEFYGKIVGETKDNSTSFEISCDKSQDNLKIQIECENAIYTVCEKDSMIVCANLNNKIVDAAFHIEFVSTITTKAAYDILKNNMCLLTTFTKSKELHLMFIKGFIDYYENLGGAKGICPIT